MNDILVLYYSHGGAVREMAQLVARGVESVKGAKARLRTVPKVSAVCEATEADVPDSGAPYSRICRNAPVLPSAARRSSAIWRRR